MNVIAIFIKIYDSFTIWLESIYLGLHVGHVHWIVANVQTSCILILNVLDLLSCCGLVFLRAFLFDCVAHFENYKCKINQDDSEDARHVNKAESIAHFNVRYPLCKKENDIGAQIDRKLINNLHEVEDFWTHRLVV